MAAETAPGFWALLFSKGGVVTWVIALLSAVGLPIAAIKLYEFYRMDIFRPHAFEEALGDMRRGKTAGLGARGCAGPSGRAAYCFCLEPEQRCAFGPGRAARSTRRAQFLVRHLSRHIWVLELIAASAPLFGLIGHGARHDHRFSRRRPGVGGG